MIKDEMLAKKPITVLEKIEESLGEAESEDGGNY